MIRRMIVGLVALSAFLLFGGAIGGSGISSNVARFIGLSDGTVLSAGAVSDGQVIARSGSTYAGASVLASDAGITSLESCDSAAGLCYPSAANTWTRASLTADQCVYSSSSSALAEYACSSASRTIIATGLGNMANQAASSVAVTGGSVTGITDLAVADGGTGASTAAAARDSIVWASAATIACSSPCTPAAGVNVVTVSGTVTINLPALSGLADGQPVTVHCDSSSVCTVTGDPSDSGTCDGGSAGAACSAITVPAHGIVGFRRITSSSWGSVQPGGVGATLRIRAYVDGSGNPTAVTQTLSGSTWTNKGTPVAPDTTQDDAAGDIAWSGTGYTGGAVYLSAEDQLSECELAIWTLSGAGNLGVTWTPTNGTQVDIGFSSNQSTEASHLEGGFIGHATTRTTWSFGGGLGASSAGTRHVIAVSDDDAMTSTACTSVAPVYATLAAAASTSPHASSVTCFTSTAVVDEAHAAVGSSLASPAVGLFACRQAITANSVTATDVIATFTFPAGELTP